MGGPRYAYRQEWSGERARLAGAEALWDETSRAALAGHVSPGAAALEVGAGGGTVARWLAERVGPSGRVLAVDLDPRFLADLTSAVVEVRRADVVADPLPDGEFDVVHARLVLEHLVEREDVLDRLVAAVLRAARPGDRRRGAAERGRRREHARPDRLGHPARHADAVHRERSPLDRAGVGVRLPAADGRGYGLSMTASGAAGARGSGVRLAEMVGALSLAADLGLGQPMEHLARSCLLACRLGERMGVAEDERAVVYYVTLLGFMGCIADSADVAPWFGDDLAYRAGVYDVDMKPVPFLGYLMRQAGSGGSAAHRFGVRATILATGARGVQDMLRTHCQVTAAIATRLGLGPEVAEPLQQIFARWDGKGLPAKVGGEQLARPVRLWQLADVVEVHHRRGGVAAATRVATERRGSQFAPAVVDCFVGCAAELLDGLPEGSSWDDLIAAEPALRPELTEAQFDAALEVFADYADLKSTFRRGHSRGVAELAAVAARRLGLGEAEVTRVRRAGLVHDIGRTGVPNTIWDKPGPLTRAERERVRLHPYYTERMLSRPAKLAELGAVAALAHERLDGSGYHRGLSGTAIDMPGRILAAADAYHDRLEPRPYRATSSAPAAAQAVREHARGGRLDADAVEAVLAAAGHPARRRAAGPAGLTGREVEVLALLARGASNRQIAHELSIAPKTVGNHVEHIYAKAGVATRTAATLFAMQHGLLRRLDPLGD